MGGPLDISTILSQSGRIEKINQSPFAQSEVARQMLTEDEARARLRKNREVSESKKAQEITVREKNREGQRRAKGREEAQDDSEPEKNDDAGAQAEKHIIDVVV